MAKDSNLDIIQKWRNVINDAPSIQDKIKQSGAKSEKEYYEQYATEQEFLNWYHQQEHNNYPKPSLTVDLIGLRWNSYTKTVQILLVQRKNHPFKDHWALPGGFVQENESINDAIVRETFEETHVQIKENDQVAGLPNIVRLPAVSKHGRDPRLWVVTNPNIVLFNQHQFKQTQPVADDDAKNARWFNIKFVNQQVQIKDNPKLAFDHLSIIQTAFKYLYQDFDHRRLPIVTNLLDMRVTLPELTKCFQQFKNIKSTTQNLVRLYPTQLIPTNDKIKLTKGVGKAQKIYIVSKA